MINSTLQWLGTASLTGMYIVMSYFNELHVLQLTLGLAGGLLYFAWSVRVANKQQMIVNSAGILVCIGGLLHTLG
jgi:uncharacterized membrane protein